MALDDQVAELAAGSARLCLTQMLDRAARTDPERLCLIYEGRSTTNAQLRDRVAALAAGLRSLGVPPDDRIVILSRNSDRFVESLFATWWAGCVAIPINTRWSQAEIVRAAVEAEPSVLLVDGPFLESAASLRAAVPSLRAVVSLDDGDPPAGVHSYERLLAGSEPIPDAERGGDDLAYLLYTGGTTGAPKGVMLSHANLLVASLSMLAAGCGTGEVYLHAPPLFHIAGLQVMTGHFLGGRGPHVIIPAFTPAAILEAIERHRVTDVMLVPTMLQMVLAHPGFSDYDLASLERIFYGAAPMTPALLSAAAEAIPGTGFVQGYGMTETALTVMLAPKFYTPEGRSPDRTASIGQALPLAEIAIRDAEGNELPHGEVGELTVRSPTVMLGYWCKPAETAATIRDGWLYSGDGAYVDSDGFIHLVDRIKDMIITGGENVYSTEVENVLATHPAVAVAAVIGVPDERLGERVHAVIVPRPGADCTYADLLGHCRRELAGYKLPRSVEIRSELPLSAAGKVLKVELRAQARAGLTAPTDV
jgi:acyl-CoA synthetase (AMP-forming)/AMP-acid ligase II